MAHFGVVGPAYFSHFNALEAIAVELIERGHRVTFLHRVDAKAFLRDPRLGFHVLGAASHPTGSLAESLRRAANPGGPLGIRAVIADMALTTDMLCRELPAAMQLLGIDAVLADQMEAAGALAADAAGIPFISIACALPVNREPGIPLPVMPFKFDTTERALQMYQGSARVYDWMMGAHSRVVAQWAATFKLSPRSMLHECLSPLAQISQTVSGFDFPRSALPATFHHVGPLRTASTSQITSAMPPVAAGRPFIFASLGTLQGQRFSLFKRIAQAARKLNAQLLIAHCGGLDAAQERALVRAGATWVTDFAPQAAVLARADAVVSHAGLNTVMDAIVARTPILALPIAFDQPGVASRVCHADIGLSGSARLGSTATLARMLEQLLKQSHFATALDALAIEVEQAGGAARAAGIIEHVLR
ncbi:glycosyltransferase [Massilia sp. S19_KUP03_FR1]|uniref:glycosyltransferase n=1 Tax=Massilia sp. S19_KUP03_FR1 TaxID=3025503 RepID=UPI002FCD1B23